jgi:hypothetical protein
MPLPPLPVDVLRLIAFETLATTKQYEPLPMSELLHCALVCRDWAAAYCAVLVQHPVLRGDLRIGLWLARPVRAPPSIHIISEYGPRSHASEEGLSALFSAMKGVQRLEFGGVVNYQFSVKRFTNPGLTGTSRFVYCSAM